MIVVFYSAAAVALAATAMAITRLHAVHALLYLIVSFLAVAVIFFGLGAPFVAALEVIVYAGAIVVLFVFVVMMLNLGGAAAARERQWLRPGVWIGPAMLALLLLLELVYGFTRSAAAVRAAGSGMVGPKQVGIALFGPYAIGVELVAMLLLAGMVGAYHLGQRRRLVIPQAEAHHGVDSVATRPAAGRSAVRPGADRPSGAT